jgi:hypothetical protein
MSGSRKLKGVISWRSIGEKCSISGEAPSPEAEVRHYMNPEPPPEVNSDAYLFDVIGYIIKHEYALVRGVGESYSGIITTTDLTVAFRGLTEPFLLLSEIENCIREWLKKRGIKSEQLARILRSPSRHETVLPQHLSFGDYICVFRDDEMWAQMKIPAHRPVVIGNLEDIRKIRNNVMHFHETTNSSQADEKIVGSNIDTKQLEALRKCHRFFKQLSQSSLHC